MNKTELLLPEILFRRRNSGRGHGLLLVWALSFMLVSGISFSASADSTLPSAEDLTHDAKLAKKEEKPILVFFSSEDCPYCEIVRDLYLQPMQENLEGANKVIIREVSIDGIDYMKDFQGTRMDHESFADQEGASFTPIVRIYSSSGELLVPELVGFSSPDFYLRYLEKSIETARKKMRKLAAVNY